MAIPRKRDEKIFAGSAYLVAILNPRDDLHVKAKAVSAGLDKFAGNQRNGIGWSAQGMESGRLRFGPHHVGREHHRSAYLRSPFRASGVQSVAARCALILAPNSKHDRPGGAILRGISRARVLCAALSSQRSSRIAHSVHQRKSIAHRTALSTIDSSRPKKRFEGIQHKEHKRSCQGLPRLTPYTLFRVVSHKLIRRQLRSIIPQ